MTTFEEDADTDESSSLQVKKCTTYALQTGTESDEDGVAKHCSI